MKPVILLAGLLAAVTLPRSVPAVPAALDARQTVVIANGKIPESVELARYYMAARGIPSNNLCVLDLPAGETIARRQYETRLRDPLQAFLREQGLVEQVRRDGVEASYDENGWRTVRHHVRYLVSMYGIPLRIAETRPYLLAKLARIASEPFSRDGAAVDSELACLLWETCPITGFQPNRMYNLFNWPRYDRQTSPILMAARLDGPSPDHVRRMIDDTIRTEQAGLAGRVFIDIRSIRDPEYVLGDFWLREAGARLERVGYPVAYDIRDETIPVSFPMDNTAFYLGWYAEHVQGPFKREGFRFQPGAIAYHLHSGSAKTLRSTTRHWAGPLIDAGAAAVMGAVDEPFLHLTPDLQVFIDRLCAGFTFGESAYLAQRALSWQITVIGDPLYRPIPSEIVSGIAAADIEGETAAWIHVMRMNRLAGEQQLNLALAYGRSIPNADWRVREKIADLYARNELRTEAAAEYAELLTLVDDEDAAFRISAQVMRLYRQLNRLAEAREVRVRLADRWPESPLLPFLDEVVP